MTLTPVQSAALEAVAAQIGVPAFTLDALILYETAGTYSPTIKNPLSSARGLIQFTDAAAKDLGFPGGSLELVTKYPDFVSQIKGPVLSYFKKAMPYTSDLDLFMQVFRPTFRGLPAGTIFPDSVTRVNAGIYTPQDYADRVYAFLPVGQSFALDAIEIKAGTGSASALPFWIWGLAGVGLVFAITKKKKRRKK